MAIYYVDATLGKDTYNGTTTVINDGAGEGPWKTVAKVNGGTFAASDQVLFKRGETWAENFNTPSAGVTYGAYGTGADPALTGAGGVTIDTNNVTLSHLAISGYSGSTYGLGHGGANTGTQINDCAFLGTGRAFFVGNAAANPTFNRCTFRNHADATYGMGAITAGAVALNYCQFSGNAGPMRFEGGNGTVNNCLFVGNLGRVFAVVNAGSTVTVNNPIVVGNAPNQGTAVVAAQTAGTLTINNPLVLPNGFDPTKLYTGVVTVNNGLAVDPQFVSPRRFAWVSLFVDDIGGLDYFTTIATYANARGVGMALAAHRPHTYTAEQWVSLAALVAAGNEIAVHTRDHCYMTIMDAVSITGRAGSTPTVSIAMTQTDASSANWSGTVTLKEGASTVKAIAVTSATTLVQLAASIAAQAGWAATVEATALGATETVLAVTLADVADQSVAVAWKAQFEQGKFWYVEIAESKAALESGIGGGYVARTFVPPYDATNATLQAWLATAANFTPAGTTPFLVARGLTGATGSYTLSTDLTDANHASPGLRIMHLFNYYIETAFKPASIAVNLPALMTALTWAGAWVGMLSHYDGLTSDEYIAVVDALLAMPGVSVVLPGETAATVRATYTDADGDGSRWTKALTDAANYHLAVGSPCINAGTDVSLTTDFDGASVPRGAAPDIGLYERQPAGVRLLVGM